MLLIWRISLFSRARISLQGAIDVSIFGVGSEVALSFRGQNLSNA
jgi:hypothetical protein